LRRGIREMSIEEDVNHKRLSKKDRKKKRKRKRGEVGYALTDKQSEIVFKVKTRRNVLKVGVLKSYTSNMGTLACCVDCAEFKPGDIVNTRWTHLVSMESLQLIHFAPILPPDDMTRNDTTRPPIQERLLRCRVTRGLKVKLTSVISC
jgi:hypothetical protein